MWWCGGWCCMKSTIHVPICTVDGEKRIYYSTHKYEVVEPAKVSYLFDEVDKVLRKYEELLQNGRLDIHSRETIKARWITLKNRIRSHNPDATTTERLKERQLLFRKLDTDWKFAYCIA